MMTRKKLELSDSLLLTLVLLSPWAQAQSQSTTGVPPAAPNVAPAHQLGVVAKIARTLEARRPSASDSLLDTSPFAPKPVARSMSPALAAAGGPAAGVHAVISGTARSKFAGLRDPFRLPAPPAAGTAGFALERPRLPGKRGLVIGQLKLLGIVRQHAADSAGAQGAMIAVVTNASNVAYFLHPGDALYDGRLTNITADAAYFEQEYRDPEGRLQRREVAKRLNTVSGEKQ